MKLHESIWHLQFQWIIVCNSMQYAIVCSMPQTQIAPSEPTPPKNSDSSMATIFPGSSRCLFFFRKNIYKSFIITAHRPLCWVTSSNASQDGLAPHQRHPTRRPRSGRLGRWNFASCGSFGNFTRLIVSVCLTHRIHVCYIWQHLPSIYPQC